MSTSQDTNQSEPLDASGPPRRRSSAERFDWRIVFSIAAAGLFAIAVMFALREPFRTAGPSSWPTNQPPPSTMIVPNTLAGLSSLGFAIAGGMALIAAALTKDNGPRSEVG
jgi:hypothetical protein